MFTDTHLAGAATALAIITIGVISISSPFYPYKKASAPVIAGFKADRAMPAPAPIPTPVPAPEWQRDGNHLRPVPPTPSVQFIQHPILPPVEYDKPYDGDLTIRIVPTFEALRVACNVYNPNMLACAVHNAKSCIIY